MGDGPDILLIDTWVHHVEAVWDFPDLARFLRRLSSFGRLIHFDRRGTGLSDAVPVEELPDFETQVGDAIAVLKAAGSESATIIGLNDGTIVATLLAAERPDLCRSLVLFTFTAGHTLAGGMPMESIDDVIAMIEASFLSGDSGVDQVAPSRVGDDLFDQHLARLRRFSIRPGAFGHFFRQTMQTDIRTVLPSIRPPALVLNRTGNPIVPVEQSRKAAAMLPDATFVELPGTDHRRLHVARIRARRPTVARSARPRSRPDAKAARSVRWDRGGDDGGRVLRVVRTSTRSGAMRVGSRRSDALARPADPGRRARG